MKFFVAFVALFALAAASPINKPAIGLDADIEAILAAINHPSTDPATAALLMDQLQSILGESPISVGPAIVDESPISVGPALVEEESPISVGPALVEEESSPVSVVEEAASSPSGTPMVQIIINVNGKPLGNPVVVEQPIPVLPEIVPTPVIVVDQPQPEPEAVVVAPVIVPTPVEVVDQPQAEPEAVVVSPVIVPTPVEVVDQPQAVPEPVIVAPIEVSPVVVLPDELN